MSEYKRWSYKGPVYYYGNKIAEKSSYYTMAKNRDAARRNFIYKIANGDKAYYYDIVDSYVELVPVNTRHEEDKIETCEICSTQLNPLGECPVCDYGEYDLLY